VRRLRLGEEKSKKKKKKPQDENIMACPITYGGHNYYYYYYTTVLLLLGRITVLRIWMRPTCSVDFCTPNVSPSASGQRMQGENPKIRFRPLTSEDGVFSYIAAREESCGHQLFWLYGM